VLATGGSFSLMVAVAVAMSAFTFAASANRTP
jgi:hypothetical protein